jgi:hypothetical protein
MTQQTGAAMAASLTLAMALAAGLATAPAASAQIILADDGEAIAERLRSDGFRADIERRDNGQLLIRSGSDGLNFFIFLRDCQDYRNCRNIQFHGSFNMQSPPTAERINDWNGSRIVGQAFLDNAGQPRIGHFVTMRGGISVEAFDEAFGFFREALRDYAVHIGFRR